jgi:hypothetical protein
MHVGMAKRRRGQARPGVLRLFAGAWDTEETVYGRVLCGQLPEGATGEGNLDENQPIAKDAKWANWGSTAARLVALWPDRCPEPSPRRGVILRLAGFQIAIDDAMIVQVLQGIDYLLRDGRRFV